MPSGSLPVALTSFVGRDDEVAGLRRALSGSRLVTLTGPGGAGKTRTAIEAARGWTGDEAIFVELAPLLDQSLIAGTIAVALGAVEAPGEPVLETIIHSLQTKRVLLVLDNCEQVVVACGLIVERLLQTCPSLTVLATSREPLNVGGEVVRRLDPLNPADAAALFVARAADAEPRFAAEGSDPALLESLCRQLDGLPLAIELAAPYVRVLSLKELAAQLDQRLELLHAASPTAVPRHQTLRALVDWSYELLTEAEQRLYRRLSVFAGGCTREAVAGICGDAERSDAPFLSPVEEGRGEGEPQFHGDSLPASAALLPLLRNLIEKSLVSAEEHEGETRYRMLETLRQHSREKLREAGEERKLRRRHLQWFRDFAEEGERARLGPEQDRWHRRIERETENCRVALVWSRVEPEQQQSGLRLATAVGRVWQLSGHASEAFDWLTALVGGAPSNATRAKALGVAGFIAARFRDPGEAQRLLEQALPLARSLDERPIIIASLNDLAYLRLQVGDHAGALAAADDGLALAQVPGSPWRPRLMFYRGLAVARMGRPQEAIDHLEEAVRAARERQDTFWERRVLRALGNLLVERGELPKARECLQASLVSGTRRPEAVGSLACFVGLVAAEGDTTGAVRLAGAVSRLAEAWPDRFAPLPGQPLEQLLRIASEVLGPAVRQAAWAEGAAMSLDEAIDYALRRGLHATTRAGERPGGLTPRELEVAQLIARGLTNRQIAHALVISERTADRHVENIRGKLRLASRGQVAGWAAAHGLVSTSEH